MSCEHTGCSPNVCRYRRWDEPCAVVRLPSATDVPLLRESAKCEGCGGWTNAWTPRCGSCVAGRTPLKQEIARLRAWIESQAVVELLIPGDGETTPDESDGFWCSACDMVPDALAEHFVTREAVRHVPGCILATDSGGEGDA